MKETLLCLLIVSSLNGRGATPRFEIKEEVKVEVLQKIDMLQQKCFRLEEQKLTEMAARVSKVQSSRSVFRLPLIGSFVDKVEMYCAVIDRSISKEQKSNDIAEIASQIDQAAAQAVESYTGLKSSAGNLRLTVHELAFIDELIGIVK